MPKPRPVIDDLRTNSPIAPQASPVDNFQYMNAASFKPSLIDFAGLSQSLTSAIAGLTFGNDEKDSELGYADFQKALAESEDGTNNQLDVLAKALASGKIGSESQSPGYGVGWARAAADAAARGFGGYAIEYNKTGIDASAQPNPETNLPGITMESPVCLPGDNRPP